MNIINSFVQKYQTKFGNIVNTDNVKLMFVKDGYDPSSEVSVREFHPESAKLTGKLFDYMLENSKAGSMVIFVGGGNGSGKSSIAGQFQDAAFVMDSTMLSIDGTRAGIQKALDKQLKPVLVFVHREPVNAWFNGVLKRKESGGHITPLSTFANAHSKTRTNFIALAEEFKGKVSVRVYENAENPARISPITFEELKNKKSLTREQLTEEINNAYTKRNLGQDRQGCCSCAVERSAENRMDARESHGCSPDISEGTRKVSGGEKSTGVFHGKSGNNESVNTRTDSIRSAGSPSEDLSSDGEPSYFKVTDRVILGALIQNGVLPSIPGKALKTLSSHDISAMVEPYRAIAKDLLPKQQMSPKIISQTTLER